MQIHELTEANILQRLKTGAQQAAKSEIFKPQALQQTRQQQYADQAAQAAKKLQAQGYKTSTPSTGMTPGQQFRVSANVGGVTANYIKTAAGWQNELGQPVTSAQSIAYLDNLLAQQTQPAVTNTATTRPGGPIMTSVEVDQAIRQMGLSSQQIDAFRTQASQNPGFVRAFLKRLGLM